jgi:hypothetical protein
MLHICSHLRGFASSRTHVEERENGADDDADADYDDEDGEAVCAAGGVGVGAGGVASLEGVASVKSRGHVGVGQGEWCHC